MEQIEQNEFNFATKYLDRLDQLFWLADISAIELDLYNRFHALSAIYEELSTEMKDPELKEFADRFDTLANKVNQIIAMQNRTGKINVPPELYRELRDISIQLRRVLDRAGLQNKRRDSAGAALK